MAAGSLILPVEADHAQGARISPPGLCVTIQAECICLHIGSRLPLRPGTVTSSAIPESKGGLPVGIDPVIGACA